MSSVSAYCAALQAALEAAFAGRVETFGDHAAVVDGKLNTPALLIEIDDQNVIKDVGDDRLPLQLSVIVHCVLGLSTQNVQRSVRDFSAEVMRVLRYTALSATDLQCDYPQDLRATTGAWRAGKHGYESQEVSFTQQIYLGTSIWAGGLTPETVYISLSPDIGIPHEADYTAIDTTP